MGVSWVLRTRHSTSGLPGSRTSAFDWAVSPPSATESGSSKFANRGHMQAVDHPQTVPGRLAAFPRAYRCGTVLSKALYQPDGPGAEPGMNPDIL